MYINQKLFMDIKFNVSCVYPVTISSSHQYFIVEFYVVLKKEQVGLVAYGGVMVTAGSMTLKNIFSSLTSKVFHQIS